MKSKTVTAFAFFCVTLLLFPLVVFPVIADENTVTRGYYYFPYGNGIDDDHDGVVDNYGEKDVFNGTRNISASANTVVDTWTNDFVYPVGGIPRGVCIGGVYEELWLVNSSINHLVYPIQTAQYLELSYDGNMSFSTKNQMLNVIMFYVNVSPAFIMNGASQLWYRSPLAWDNKTYQGTQHYLNIYDDQNNLVYASTDSDTTSGAFKSRIPDPKILVDKSGNFTDAEIINLTAAEHSQHIKYAPHEKIGSRSFFNRSYFQLNMNFRSGSRYRFEEYVKTQGNNPINNITIFMARSQDIAGDREKTTYVFWGTPYARTIPVECSWGLVASIGKGRAGSELLIRSNTNYTMLNNPTIITHRFSGDQTVNDVKSISVVLPIRTSKPLNISVAYRCWSRISSIQTIPDDEYHTGTFWTWSPSFAHDGNWWSSAVPVATGSLFYNYTIPVDATSLSLFRAHQGTSSWINNVTLPAGCYGHGKLVFRTDLDANFAGSAKTYVWNFGTSTWYLIQSDIGEEFYESEMIWDVGAGYQSWVSPLVLRNVTGTLTFNMNINDPDVTRPNDYQLSFTILNFNTSTDAMTFSVYPSHLTGDDKTDATMINYGLFGETEVYYFSTDIQIAESSVALGTVNKGTNRTEFLVGALLILGAILIAFTIVGVPVSATIISGTLTIGSFSGLAGPLIMGTLGAILIFDSYTGELGKFASWIADGTIRLLEPIWDAIHPFIDSLMDFAVAVVNFIKWVGDTWAKYGDAILHAVVEIIWFIVFVIVLMLWSAFLVSMKYIAKGDVDGALRALFRPVKKPLVYLERKSYQAAKGKTKTQKWWKKLQKKKGKSTGA